MANQNDMRILYDGIEGKTSIDEKSGLNIKNDLIGVAKKLNQKENRPRIIVNLDEPATRTALSASLKKIIDSLKIEPVKIKFDLSEINNSTNSKSKKPVSNSQPIMSQTGLKILDVDIRKFDEMTNKSVELSGALTTLHSCRSALESNGKITTDNQILSTYKEQYKLVSKLAGLEKSSGVENAKDSREKAKNLRDLANAQGQFNKKVSEFKKFGYNNTVFNKSSEFKAEYETLGVRYQSLIGSDNIPAMKQLNSDFDIFKRKVTEAGLLGQTFTDKLSAQMQKLGVYFSAAGLMMGAFNQVKNMIKDVVELDGAVTDLQIATGGTREETEKLLNTYTKLGKEIGATTIDVAASADTFLRQGKSIKDTNTLIKDSIVLGKLGKISSEEAAQALTSSMKGYKLEVSEAIGAVDKFTAIDKDAAVSAGYLAKAIAETATGARLGGVEMDRLAGYIALVGETTQDGAESVGVFFKSMFARMGNIKEGKLIDPETQEDISTVESTLGNLGIMLRKNGGEFRNYGDVLDDVAAKWSGLSDVNRQALAVAFGQTRNQEKFLTLMDGYSTAMEYAGTAANSAGTAMSKYENSYLPSVEAAQERFTAQFEALSRTVIDSGIITDTIDSGTGLLGALTAIIDKVEILPTLITVAAGAWSGLTNKGGYAPFTKIAV